MTDLEITKACAEAMGLQCFYPFGEFPYVEGPSWAGRDTSKDNLPLIAYAPLTNDAQAMALVKLLELRIQEPEAQGDRRWRVTGWNPVRSVAQETDLNRAIVECVATMQAAKVEA